MREQEQEQLQQAIASGIFSALMGYTIIMGIIVGVFAVIATMASAADLSPTPGPLEVHPNAYGLGVNSDQYGRPHAYQQPDGTPVPGVFQDQVRRDAYGEGVHADPFGNPVIDAPPED